MQVGLVVAVTLFLCMPINTDDFEREAVKTPHQAVLRNMVDTTPSTAL